jgi:two-component system, NarL family, sensor kinase
MGYEKPAMIPQKQNYYLVSILIIISLLFLLISCQKKKEAENIVYKKQPEEKLDSLSAWFCNDENYKEKGYLPQFYVHFNEKMNAKNWEEAAQLLRFAGRAAYLSSKSDKALLKTHIDFMNQHENDISGKYKSGIYVNIGLLNNYATNNKAAIYYLNKATKVTSKDYQTQENIATAYNEMSYNYASLGQLDKALEAALMSLKKSEALKDTFGIGATYDSIAGIYQSMKDYENAEICYDKAIVNLQLMKNNSGIFAVYLNKLGLYEEYKNEKLFPMIDTTFAFYQQSKLSADSDKIYAYSWYGFKLLKEKKIAETRKLLNEIKPLFDKSDEKHLYSKYFESAILYDQLTGSNTIDREIFKAAIPLYKANSDFVSLALCYCSLKEYAIKNKDYKAALFYQEEYQKASNSLAENNIILKTKELDKKYQTEKREQQIALQKIELSQKNTYIALLIAILGSLFFAVLGYYAWQKQRRLKQDKINTVNFTKQLLENIEVERKRIATDLHDSISHELLTLKSFFHQDIGVVDNKIDSIINDVRIISRNLHPVMFDKIGLILNIEQLVERLQLQYDFLIITNFSYSNSLPSASELQLYRIIQEALNNIIKHAQAHAAKITIQEKTDIICVEIKDNGRGFDVTKALNSGNAFGLHNIIERSRAIGGEASIKSSSEGTTINIDIKR